MFKSIKPSLLTRDSNASVVPRNDFCMQLLKALCEEGEFDTGLYSPFTLQLTLLFFCSFITEDARSELSETFRLFGNTPDVTTAAHNKLMSEVNDLNLFSEVCLIVDQNVKPDKSFLTTLKGIRNFQLYVLNFNKRQKVYNVIKTFLRERQSPIRSYVMGKRGSMSSNISAQTASGKFVDLNPPLDQTTMLLLNYTYLKCTLKFSTRQLRLMFHDTSESSAEIDMLRTCEPLRILRSDRLKATLVELPLENSKNSFLYVILPLTYDGMPRTLSTLNDFNLSMHLNYFKLVLVTLTLPKFSIKCQVSLKNILQMNGINSFFDKERCFTKQTANRHVGVDLLYQSSVMVIECIERVDTESLEHSEKDIMNPGSVSQQETILVDRPFLFLVTQNDADGRGHKSIVMGKFSGESS